MLEWRAIPPDPNIAVLISFRFNLAKSIAVVAYILEQLNAAVEKVKLMKLVYLADKAHFLRTGIPITGDRLCAMPWGPAPSLTLNAIDGELQPQHVFKFIHTEDVWVSLRAKPADVVLSASELQTLNEVIKQHGHKPAWSLVKETHRLPEYENCYVEGTSRLIPFEKIAQYSGDESRFRHGRPVISPETAAAMECPFQPDPDL